MKWLHKKKAKNSHSLCWEVQPLVVTVVTNISYALGTFLPSAHGLRVREENSIEFGENWISFLQNLGFNVFPPRSDRWKQYQSIWMSCTRGRWRKVTRITSSQVALMDFEEKYKYTDTKTSIRVFSKRLWQLWWWLFEICKISRIELSLTSYEFVVKSDSTWELQAPGTVGNEKNECQI